MLVMNCRFTTKKKKMQRSVFWPMLKFLLLSEQKMNTSIIISSIITYRLQKRLWPKRNFSRNTLNVNWLVFSDGNHPWRSSAHAAGRIHPHFHLFQGRRGVLRWAHLREQATADLCILTWLVSYAWVRHKFRHVLDVVVSSPGALLVQYISPQQSYVQTHFTFFLRQSFWFIKAT